MDMHIVTVYDIQNKFIAHTAPYPDVIDVVSEWGSLYILSGDRKVCVTFCNYIQNIYCKALCLPK